MDDGGAAGEDALARARETIARQEWEIERLRRRVADDQFAEQLRDALRFAATAGTVAAPVAHARLLEMIVETAADVIKARAASLFLIDEAAGELTFEVALGEKAEEVKKFRIPLGHGIAGLVAVSGQPMAIADTGSDTRDAADIAQAIGYVPRNILCVPLFYDDQVIGVLELLDKEGAASFSAADMESLGLFANQAAVAIEQSRAHETLTGLLAGIVRSVGGAADGPRGRERARAFAAGLDAEPAHHRTLELARLVHEIAGQGEPELRACREILSSFAEYLRSRPGVADGLGMMR